MKNSSKKRYMLDIEESNQPLNQYQFLNQLLSKQLKNISLTTPCLDLQMEQQTLKIIINQGNMQKYELDFLNLMISSERDNITEITINYNCQKGNTYKIVNLWQSLLNLKHLKSFCAYFNTQSQMDDQQTKYFFEILTQLKQLETLELQGPNLITERKQEEYLEQALKNQFSLKSLSIHFKFLLNMKISNICQSISQGLQYQTNLESLTFMIFSNDLDLKDADTLFRSLKHLKKLQYLKIIFQNIMGPLYHTIKENYEFQESLFQNLKHLECLQQLEITIILNSSFDCDQIILDIFKLPSLNNLRLNLGEQHYVKNSYEIKQSLQSILTRENQEDQKNLNIYLDVNKHTFYFLRKNRHIILNVDDYQYKNNQILKNNYEQDIQFQTDVLQSLIQYDNLKQEIQCFNFQMIQNDECQQNYVSQYYDLSSFLQKYSGLQNISLGFKTISLELLAVILETCSNKTNLDKFKITTSHLFEKNSNQTEGNIEKIRKYLNLIYKNCNMLSYLEFQNLSNLIETTVCLKAQTTTIRIKLDLLHSLYKIRVLLCFLPEVNTVDTIKLDLYPQNQPSDIMLEATNLINPLINQMSKLENLHIKLISTFNPNLSIPSSFLESLKIENCINQYSLSFPQVEFKFLKEQPTKQGLVQILLYDCSSIIIVNEFLRINSSLIFEISLILKCKKIQEKVGIGKFIKQINSMSMLKKFVIQSDSKIFRYNRTFNYLFVFSLLICYRQFCREKLLNQSIAFKKLNSFYRPEIYYDMIKLGLTPEIPQINIEFNDFIEKFVGGQIGFENVGEEDFLDVNRFIIYTEPISIDHGPDSFSYQFLNASDKNVQLEEFFM